MLCFRAAQRRDMMTSFDDLQLDAKLSQALKKKNFSTPTPVQATCIPAALLGKDLVAQARTGTGKTLAYVLPALHRILAGSNGSAAWQALVLVPTRELCEQVKPAFRTANYAICLLTASVRVTGVSVTINQPAALGASNTV